MPMTLDQLRRQLSAIEPEDAMYAEIGPTEILLLQQLLTDPEPWMSARAIYALSRIANEGAVAAIQGAITDSRPEVRVAIAASAANLAVSYSNVILAKLLGDKDIGVRKFAVQSITVASDPAIHTKLQSIEAQDPVSQIRDQARLKRKELESKPRSLH